MNPTLASIPLSFTHASSYQDRHLSLTTATSSRICPPRNSRFLSLTALLPLDTLASAQLGDRTMRTKLFLAVLNDRVETLVNAPTRTDRAIELSLILTILELYQAKPNTVRATVAVETKDDGIIYYDSEDVKKAIKETKEAAKNELPHIPRTTHQRNLQLIPASTHTN